MAVGTKNGVIKIFCCKSGVKLKELYGHSASVCSMSLIGDDWMSSGGDIGCCKLIIWDLKNYEIYHKYTEHKAAITSILDL